MPHEETRLPHPKPQNVVELAAFDIYFASIRSMQFHPGAGTREHTVLNAEACRDAALEMLAVRRTMMNSGD